MISRQCFVHALECIVRQNQINDEVSSALEKVCEFPVLFGTKNLCAQALLNVLQDAMHDDYDTIGWWLYDSSDKCIHITEGGKEKEIRVDTAEQLYDYMVANFQ